jgi:hypothetical protein
MALVKSSLVKGGNEWVQCPMVEQLPGRDERSNVRESHSLLCRLGTRILESFEVVQIADANHVEVSMAPSDQTIPRQIRELL